MKLILITLATFFLACSALDLAEEWEHFKERFEKNYLSEEEHFMRKEVFARNMKFIEKHNAKANVGLHSFTVGINKFADQTPEEFFRSYRGPVPKPNVTIIQSASRISYPERMDYREKGWIGPVQDQNQGPDGNLLSCNSGWAFSTTANIEAAFCKAGKELPESLSEQNLIDCSLDFPNAGCNGGSTYAALNFVLSEGGIDPDRTYPYEADQGPCRYIPDYSAAYISRVVGSAPGDEKELLRVLASFGPVSADVDADQPSFMLYESGIYSDDNCKTDREDLYHSVFIVGYDSMDGQDYWIVKNSFGTSWGMDGYMYIARNSNNMCGIASNNLQAIV